MHQAKVVCVCGEDRYELAFRLCDSSQHSREPSEEVGNARYRQETRTDDTWIILNRAQFSARKILSDRSLSLIMYRSGTLMIVLCDIFVCTPNMTASAVPSCHHVTFVASVFLTALTSALVCVSFCVIQENGAGLCTLPFPHACLFQSY